MSESKRRIKFNLKVYEIVRSIPSGRVMSYGKIAALIPPPKGMSLPAYARVRARWAGYAMAGCPDDVPWQRVVNAQGRVSQRPGFGPQLQRQLLEEEGVEFDGQGRINMRTYAWEPPIEWILPRGLLPPAG